MSAETFDCGVCGERKPVLADGGTGYGVEPETGIRICYACCGKRDQEAMARDGVAVMYLHRADGTPVEVINWCGSLRLRIDRYRKSDHNFAGRNGRTDVWLIGPDGAEWHGMNIGDNDIVRCKRLKKK